MLILRNILSYFTHSEPIQDTIPAFPPLVGRPIRVETLGSERQSSLLSDKRLITSAISLLSV
jgi:hypothetical protein